MSQRQNSNYLHMPSHESGKNVEELNRGLVHSFDCPHCTFRTLQLSTLHAHLQSQHQGQLHRVTVYTCPWCHAQATDAALIEEHRFVYHAMGDGGFPMAMPMPAPVHHYQPMGMQWSSYGGGHQPIRRLQSPENGSSRQQQCTTFHSNQNDQSGVLWEHVTVPLSVDNKGANSQPRRNGEVNVTQSPSPKRHGQHQEQMATAVDEAMEEPEVPQIVCIWSSAEEAGTVDQRNNVDSSIGAFGSVTPPPIPDATKSGAVTGRTNRVILRKSARLDSTSNQYSERSTATSTTSSTTSRPQFLQAVPQSKIHQSAPPHKKMPSLNKEVYARMKELWQMGTRDPSHLKESLQLFVLRDMVIDTPVRKTDLAYFPTLAMIRRTLEANGSDFPPEPVSGGAVTKLDIESVPGPAGDHASSTTGRHRVPVPQSDRSSLPLANLKPTRLSTARAMVPNESPVKTRHSREILSASPTKRRATTIPAASNAEPLVKKHLSPSSPSKQRQTGSIQLSHRRGLVNRQLVTGMQKKLMKQRKIKLVNEKPSTTNLEQDISQFSQARLTVVLEQSALMRQLESGSVVRINTEGEMTHSFSDLVAATAAPPCTDTIATAPDHPPASFVMTSPSPPPTVSNQTPVTTVTNGELVCGYCFGLFEGEAELDNHLLEVHPQE